MKAADPTLRHVLAVTGASGSVFARSLLRSLSQACSEVHWVVSPAGLRVAAEETDARAGTGAELAELWLEGVERRAKLVVHDPRDIGASIASGSFRHDGMVIAPCSMATGAAIAHGTSTNLVHRAAECTLKERRRLVLMIRESPLSLVHAENILALTRAGATVMPLSPPWYHRPKTLGDLVEDTCARALDHLGLSELVPRRWTGGVSSVT